MPFQGVFTVTPMSAGRCPGLAYRYPFGAQGAGNPPFPLGGVGGRLFVQADMLSACMEYKDMLSDNGIANADIPHDGIANPAERV